MMRHYLLFILLLFFNVTVFCQSFGDTPRTIIEYENSLPEDLKEENLSFPYRVSSTDADDYIEVLMPDAEILTKDFIIQDSDTLVFLYDLNPGWIAIAH